MLHHSLRRISKATEGAQVHESSVHMSFYESLLDMEVLLTAASVCRQNVKGWNLFQYRAGLPPFRNENKGRSPWLLGVMTTTGLYICVYVCVYLKIFYICVYIQE